MSVCTFIASDYPLQEVAPEQILKYIPSRPSFYCLRIER